MENLSKVLLATLPEETAALRGRFTELRIKLSGRSCLIGMNGWKQSILLKDFMLKIGKEENSPKSLALILHTWTKKKTNSNCPTEQICRKAVLAF